MREVARGESALPASIAITPASSDFCVRVVLGAGAPVVAALQTERQVLVVSEAGTRVLFDARGPICSRKGTALRVEVQGTKEGPVRYVVWMVP
jgi:hypothetical protein